MSTVQERQNAFQKFLSNVGFDQNPAIAQLQRQWWDIYIPTGEHSDNIHNKAESIRKQSQAVNTSPVPTNNIQQTNSDPLTPAIFRSESIDKYITIGIGFMFLSFIFSLFRR